MLVMKIAIKNVTKGVVLDVGEWVPVPRKESPASIMNALKPTHGMVAARLDGDGEPVPSATSPTDPRVSGWRLSKTVAYPKALASAPKSEREYKQETDLLFGWRERDGAVKPYSIRRKEAFDGTAKDATPSRTIRKPLTANTAIELEAIADQLRSLAKRMKD